MPISSPASSRCSARVTLPTARTQISKEVRTVGEEAIEIGISPTPKSEIMTNCPGS